MRNVRSDERGINALIFPLIALVLFFIAALVFGLWAYNSRQDYKNNVDQKIQAAVDVAKKETATQKDNEFIDREKQPLKDYQGPTSYGSVQVKYPKTWSAYVDESGKAGVPVDGYFQPNYVQGVNTPDVSYALRLQVLNRTFANELGSYDAQIKGGKATTQPYKPVNVPGVVGVRLDGEPEIGKKGVVILIPLRDKTIKLSTEADQYKQDFTDNILPNFSFTP